MLQVLANRITRPFSPAQAHQARLVREYLDALAEEEWERVQQLCLTIVPYVHLTPSLFSPATGLGGDRSLSRLCPGGAPAAAGYRLDHSVVFEQRGQQVARYGCSWQGRDGQRLCLAGSVVFRCAGEQIAQIGVTVNRQRMHALLAHTASG